MPEARVSQANLPGRPEKWAGQGLHSPDRTLRSDAESHTSRKQNVVLSEVSSWRVESSANFQGGKECQAILIIT